MGKINANLFALIVLGIALNASVVGQSYADNQLSLVKPPKIIFQIGSWGLGVVQDNTVRYYYPGVNGWVEKPQYEFILPNGYETVFGGLDYIWVIVGNTVKTFVHDTIAWVETPQFELVLPDRYERVIGGLGFLGVVANNKLRTYALTNRTYGWEKSSVREFPFTNNEMVFWNGFGLSTIVNDTVLAYRWDHENGAWSHWPEVDFVLPNGYETVFIFGIYLCVVVNNKVTFHLMDYNDFSWNEVSEMQLNF